MLAAIISFTPKQVSKGVPVFFVFVLSIVWYNNNVAICSLLVQRGGITSPPAKTFNLGNMKIEPKHALFNLIDYIERGVTEIVLKNDQRFYVLEPVHEVKKVIYYYKLKDKDPSSAYFTRFWHWDDGKKNYSFDLIRGKFNLNDIDYVTTEPLTKEDLNELVTYTKQHHEICPKHLMSEDCMTSIMIDSEVTTLAKISRFLYSYIA